MKRPRTVVCSSSPGRLLAAWPILHQLEEEGARLQVSRPGPLADLLPTAWTLAGEGDEGRPERALLLESRPAAVWAALRSGARHWQRLPVPERGGPVPGGLGLGDEDRALARERLGRAGVEPREIVVAVHPARGAPRSWVELVQALRRDLREVRPILAVTPDELWTAVRIHEQCARSVPVLGAEGRSRDLAAVLEATALVLGSDDWVLALARALGVPALPWNPPRSARSRGSFDVDGVLERVRGLLEG